ncbi:capsule biosynthesis protein [Ovoidimarina sediminis]|uniref:capsule biosynthesis protein n=1 Tax=Ovoidimarina sediminis TaxID=3079856 RepID=UPI002911274D|nr:capsule biosynthesis protein CapA [Rhodophyticola sp. MJ-SS7]MDU8943442.1 capsule biosynthesis protein CapA [Rhodophyticola sp. MJ-SS7]
MTRRFLFLQGPHGPFFAELAGTLARAGARVGRVLFNRGDRMFWPGRLGGTLYRGGAEDWPGWLHARIARDGVSDLVIYGDTRPVHRAAVEAARQAGVTVHVFEEGYLRPWWVSYEREGSNGASRLNALSVAEMAEALAAPHEGAEAPEGWGALYRHMAYGALYHGAMLSGGPRLPSHREVPVGREARLHLLRLMALPAHALEHRVKLRGIRRRAAPFHLVLLQLDHDANFRHYGPFPDSRVFVDTVLKGFAEGAPAHHRLVFKAHPLEDGRVPMRPLIAERAAAYGVAGRVDYVPGGRLGALLDACRTAVTVNSTGAQQALLRGRPVKAFGQAVYARQEFVSGQPLQAFFADPMPPDTAAYHVFRQFLLETSQIPGSFYAATGRRQILRRAADMMLAADDPYTLRLRRPRQLEGAARPQHLRMLDR